MLRIMILLALPMATMGQTWTVSDSITFPSNISAITSDYMGNVLVGLDNGTIIKVSEKKKVQHLNVPEFGGFTLIEAWNPLRPFIYSADLQTYAFIERFTSRPVTYPIAAFTEEFVALATTGQDNTVWTLEMPKNQVINYNLNTKRVLLNVPLTNIGIESEVSFMKAYKQLLILSTSEALFVLDQFGNLTKKYSIDGISHFTVTDDRVHRIAGGSLIGVDLRTNKLVRMSIPRAGVTHAIGTSGGYCLVHRQKLVWYTLD